MMPQDVINDLQRRVPAVFGTPHEDLSERYVYVPTYEVLNILYEEGFKISSAGQVGRGSHAKHVIRMRQNNDTKNWEQVGLGSLIPEIVLRNSHDGKSMFEAMFGIMRLVCMNGMTVPTMGTQSTAIKHLGSAEEVVDTVFEVIKRGPEVLDGARQMQQIDLQRHEQEAFAKAAKVIRWGEDNDSITPDALLTIRRAEDREHNLWSTFSRVQENITKGGYVGGRRKIRPIKSVTEDVRLNKALWILAEELKKYKS